MSQRARAALALCLAPLVGALIASALSVTGYSLHRSPVIFPPAAAISAVMTAAFSYLFMFVFELPLHVLMQKLRIRHLLHYVFAGLISGVLAIVVGIGAIMATHYYYTVGVGTDLMTVLIAPLYGALIASFFWLIRRPERDRPNPVN